MKYMAVPKNEVRKKKTMNYYNKNYFAYITLII